MSVRTRPDDEVPFDAGSGNGHRHVLLVGALEGSVGKVAPMLRRAEFDVHAVDATDFVPDLVMGTSFELLIVGYPAPHIDIGTLLDAVRDPNSGSRNAGLLLLAEPGFLEAAQGLVALGANRAVGMDWATSRLWQAIGDLLDVAPRVAMRALVYADVEVQGGRDRSLYQTVNLSVSGMLLRGAEQFTPGARFDLLFCLPADPRPIEGTAEIVRRASGEREGVQGLGIRFLHLREDGRFRIERFISSRLL